LLVSLLIWRSVSLPECQTASVQCADELTKTKKAALREQSGPGIQLLKPAQERLVLM
tara:strand:+ start:614 stop:784 length:171 start_codon:yes stop_codon:yes gene_type:complete